MQDKKKPLSSDYEAWNKNYDVTVFIQNDPENPIQQCNHCKYRFQRSAMRNNSCFNCHWQRSRLLFISKQEAGTFSQFPFEIIREITRHI